MSLFGPVYVTAVLALSSKQEAALLAGSSALVGINQSFKALLDRLGDLGSGDLTPEQAQQVTDLIARLKQSGDALQAAEAAQPPA